MRPDIKKRREKYENVITPAMKIFSGKDMIIERKTGMKIAHYKYMRGLQTRALKLLFKKPADPRIARLMVPHRNPWLEYQVSLRRAIKDGRLEEVKPSGQWWSLSSVTDAIINFFNFIRKAYGQPSLPPIRY